MKNKFPPQIEKLKRYCWVCDDFDKKKEIYIVGDGLNIQKLYRKVIKKKIYIFVRYAPLGCYLAHTEKETKNFYKDKNWFGWKRGKEQ